MDMSAGTVTYIVALVFFDLFLFLVVLFSVNSRVVRGRRRPNVRGIVLCLALEMRDKAVQSSLRGF